MSHYTTSKTTDTKDCQNTKVLWKLYQDFWELRDFYFAETFQVIDFEVKWKRGLNSKALTYFTLLLSWIDSLKLPSRNKFRKGCSGLKIELEYLFIREATVHAPKTKIDHL